MRTSHFLHQGGVRTTWPENGGKQAWLQPCQPLPALHLLPHSKLAAAAVRHAVDPAIAAKSGSSLPLPSPPLPRPPLPGDAASAQPPTFSSSYATVHKAPLEQHSPPVHSQLRDPSTYNGRSTFHGSSSSEDSVHHLSPSTNGALRTSRKSSRLGRPSPLRQQQQQGEQQHHHHQPALESQGSLRARYLCAIKCSDTVSELHSACLRIEAACQEKQQPRHRAPSGGLLAPGIQEETRFQQQRGLPHTRYSRKEPVYTGLPPPAIIVAAASRLAELLKSGLDVGNDVGSWDAARQHSSSRPPLGSSTPAADRQHPQQGLRVPFEPQEGQWVQQGLGFATAMQAGAALQQRRATRQLCSLLCRWVEGCVDSGRGSGLQHGFAAGRLLLCLARGVQVAGPSCVSGRAPALLAALLLHSPGSWPPAAPVPASTVSVPVQVSAPRPSSPSAQREAAAVACMHQQQQWQPQGQQQEQQPVSRDINEQERNRRESLSQDRLAMRGRPGSSALAPHHVASLAWAAAVIGPRHFLRSRPRVGLKVRRGVHASKLSSSKSSRRARGRARRQPQSLLCALLDWLYSQSELVLASLSTAQLVQLLWGLARLRKPVPKARAGIAPRESALPSRVRAFLLVSKTRAATGGPSTCSTRSSPRKKVGRTKKRSHSTPCKSGLACLPCPPPSWWRALEAAVLPNRQPPWQRPPSQAPIHPQQQPHFMPPAVSPSMPSRVFHPPSPPVTPPSYNGSVGPASEGGSGIDRSLCVGKNSSSNTNTSSSMPGLNFPSPGSLRPASPPPPLLTRMSAAELALLIWSLGGLHRPQATVLPRLRLLTSSPQQPHPSFLRSGQRLQLQQQQLQQQQQFFQQQQQQQQQQLGVAHKGACRKGMLPQTPQSWQTERDKRGPQPKEDQLG
uniref:Uncharacterized protein n=1 Tax=Dunaliella tertiolecta TaxID=3047 RepID=A0A7S3VP48_DUNTE